MCRAGIVDVMGKRMLNMELSDKRKRERSQRRLTGKG